MSTLRSEPVIGVARPARGPVRVAAGVVRSLRPKQWSKNVFLFAGVVFAGRLTDLDALVTAAAAFAAFCALSGGAYLVNDVLDAEADRAHPRKSRRPIAAGVVPPALAVVVSVALGAAGLAGAFLINVPFGLAAAGYLALTFAYSFVLKHVLLVDVISLSMFYVLRAAAGALAIDVPVSPWLLLCTTLLALFIGITKRRHELIVLRDGAAEHRPILDGYSEALLDQMISLVSSSILISYALYTFFSEHGRQSVMLVATFPFVVYGLFRYLYLVYKRGQGGSPEDLVLSDVPLLVCVALWCATVVGILYWR